MSNLDAKLFDHVTARFVFDVFVVMKRSARETLELER